MAYASRTGPFVSSLGSFDTIAELISGHPATLYNPGTTAYAADLGLVVSNGTAWLSAGSRFKVAASGIPVFNAPTGTMAANGAITLGTALALAYANCWIALPAGAIAAGSAAGVYFCQMSSTTVGTVFNNVLASGVPTIPASPTAFVTTGPGAYTGITGNQTLISIPVPGNAMGPNGGLIITCLASNNNSAGTKGQFLQYGGGSLMAIGQTTSQSVVGYREIWNRGVTNSQVATAFADVFGAANVNPPILFTRDTTVAQNIDFRVNQNTATDWASFEHFNIEVIPG